MARFSYQARNQSGRLESGSLEAANQDEAVSILQNRQLWVVSIGERSGESPTRLHRRAARSHRGVTRTDLVVFARSLSSVTQAGLPLLNSLETIVSQTRSQRLSAALTEIVQDIRGGSTFRDSVAKHPSIFSPFWISLLETGEASGQLAKALEQITAHLERSGAIQRKIISALTYPAILLMAAVIAILIFVIKIIPTFAAMFSSFGAQLPLLTRGVIALSHFIKSNVLLIMAGTVGTAFLFSSYIKTKQGRWQFDRLLLQMPVLGTLFQNVVTQEFASNLGTLLKAGVPILHALDIVISTSSNKVAGSLIEIMRTGVREGKTLADPLAESDIFPALVAQMLTVGEQTGKLSDMLEEIGKHYDEQVSASVDQMTALLEPIMLIGIGLIVGILVLSMYLPIFQMTSVVKG